MKDVMFVGVSVWQYVRLSVRLLTNVSMDFDKIFGVVGRGPETNRLDFGGVPALDTDPGI